MHPSLRHERPSARQQGVTMIEVLVTVIVLSIGLLGLASLQANGMRFNHSAQLRSQATFLAYDIADAMRANRTNALGGDYNTGSVSGFSGSGTQAAADLSNLANNLALLLPDGDASITQANGNEFTVTILWRDEKTTGAPLTGLAVEFAL